VFILLLLLLLFL